MVAVKKLLSEYESEQSLNECCKKTRQPIVVEIYLVLKELLVFSKSKEAGKIHTSCIISLLQSPFHFLHPQHQSKPFFAVSILFIPFPLLMNASSIMDRWCNILCPSVRFIYVEFNVKWNVTTNLSFSKDYKVSIKKLKIFAKLFSCLLLLSSLTPIKHIWNILQIFSLFSYSFFLLFYATTYVTLLSHFAPLAPEKAFKLVSLPEEMKIINEWRWMNFCGKSDDIRLVAQYYMILYKCT